MRVSHLTFSTALLTICLSALSAGAATLDNKMFTRTVPSGCADPTPVTAVTTADPQVYLWFLVSNTKVGDAAAADWIRPDGSVYSHRTWSALDSTGTYCYKSPLVIAGEAPASAPGIWTVNVTWNAERFFTLQVTIAAPGAKPVISRGGVVHLVTAEGRATSNGWISVWGQNLSSTTRSWQSSDFQNNRLPTSLDGVRVLVDGLPGYLSYISPQQINVLVPDGIKLESVEVVVDNANGRSDPVIVGSYRNAPALMVYSAPANKYPIAIHTDGTFAGSAGLISGATFRPAIPGETLTVYGVGFGPVNGAPATGTLFHGAYPLDPVKVTVGGRISPSATAWLISPGLYQVNFTVPPNAAQGDARFNVELANGGITQGDVYLTVGSGSSSGGAVDPPVSGNTSGTCTLTIYKACNFQTGGTVDNGQPGDDLSFYPHKPYTIDMPYFSAKHIREYEVEPNASALTASQINSWDDWIAAPVVGHYLVMQSASGRYYSAKLKSFENQGAAPAYWKVSFDWREISIAR